MARICEKPSGGIRISWVRRVNRGSACVSDNRKPPGQRCLRAGPVGCVLGLLTLATISGSAQAGSLDDFTSTTTLTTDYRFRGVSQNARALTPQIEIDWNGPRDWSAGVFGSLVNPHDHENTSLEFVLYANKHIAWRRIGVDLSVNYYGYPNHHPRAGSPHYSSFEFIGDVHRYLGRLDLNASFAWSPSYFGEGHAWYVAGGAAWQITPWLAASANLGEQGAQIWDGNARFHYPYTHWDAGLTATYRNVTLDIRYMTSSLPPQACYLTQGDDDWCSGTVVASLSYKFDAGLP